QKLAPRRAGAGHESGHLTRLVDEENLRVVVAEAAADQFHNLVHQHARVTPRANRTTDLRRDGLVTGTLRHTLLQAGKCDHKLPGHLVEAAGKLAELVAT